MIYNELPFFLKNKKAERIDHSSSLYILKIPEILSIKRNTIYFPSTNTAGIL